MTAKLTKVEKKFGTGLLGFDGPKPLGPGEIAYLSACGVEGVALEALLDEFRGGLAPAVPLTSRDLIDPL